MTRSIAADPNICADCHGAGGVTADSIESVINSDLNALQSALGAAWKRLMVDNYPVVIGGACGTASATNPITAVEWVYSRGTRLNVTVNGTTTCSNLAPTSITVSNWVPPVTTPPTANNLQNFTLLVPGYDNVWKAQWNYGLLWEDSALGTGARGVHNPDFSNKILTRATTAVNAVSP